MDRTQTYKKLSGNSLISIQGSYLGDDHLLIVDGRYKETYRRLKYEDIEAILICPTKTGGVLAVILGVLALFFFVIGMISLPNTTAFGILIFFTVLFACLVGYILFQGGTVVFGVQTAVQTVVLEGVNTQRKGSKAHAQLSRKVEGVQGVLSAEALQAAILKTETKKVSSPLETPPPLEREIEAGGEVGTIEMKDE